MLILRTSIFRQQHTIRNSNFKERKCIKCHIKYVKCSNINIKKLNGIKSLFIPESHIYLYFYFAFRNLIAALKFKAGFVFRHNWILLRQRITESEYGWPLTLQDFSNGQFGSRSRELILGFDYHQWYWVVLKCDFPKKIKVLRSIATVRSKI